jgi:hypothetical protein
MFSAFLHHGDAGPEESRVKLGPALLTFAEEVFSLVKLLLIKVNFYYFFKELDMKTKYLALASMLFVLSGAAHSGRSMGMSHIGVADSYDSYKSYLQDVYRQYDQLRRARGGR